MRALAILAALGLAACGTPDPDDRPAPYSDTRQQPTVTTPGISISGYANVGVARTF